MNYTGLIIKCVIAFSILVSFGWYTNGGLNFIVILSALGSTLMVATPLFLHAAHSKKAIETEQPAPIDPLGFDPRVDWIKVNQMELECDIPVSEHPKECRCSVCAAAQPPKFASDYYENASTIVRTITSGGITQVQFTNGEVVTVPSDTDVASLRPRRDPRLPDPFRDPKTGLTPSMRDEKLNSLAVHCAAGNIDEKTYYKEAKKLAVKKDDIRYTLEKARAELEAKQRDWEVSYTRRDSKQFAKAYDPAPYNEMLGITSAPPEFKVGDIVEADVAELAVRWNPAVTNNIRRHVPRGYRFKIGEVRGNWLFVGTSDHNYQWIDSRYVRKVTSAPSKSDVNGATEALVDYVKGRISAKEFFDCMHQIGLSNSEVLTLVNQAITDRKSLGLYVHPRLDTTAPHDFKVGDLLEVTCRAFAYPYPGAPQQEARIVSIGQRGKVTEFQGPWIKIGKEWYVYIIFKKVTSAPSGSEFHTEEIVSGDGEYTIKVHSFRPVKCIEDPIEPLVDPVTGKGLGGAVIKSPINGNLEIVYNDSGVRKGTYDISVTSITGIVYSWENVLYVPQHDLFAESRLTAVKKGEVIGVMSK